MYSKSGEMLAAWTFFKELSLGEALALPPN
jgi:hypothetical protein